MLISFLILLNAISPLHFIEQVKWQEASDHQFLVYDLYHSLEPKTKQEPLHLIMEFADLQSQTPVAFYISLFQPRNTSLEKHTLSGYLSFLHNLHKRHTSTNWNRVSQSAVYQLDGKAHHLDLPYRSYSVKDAGDLKSLQGTLEKSFVENSTDVWRIKYDKHCYDLLSLYTKRISKNRHNTKKLSQVLIACTCFCHMWDQLHNLFHEQDRGHGIYRPFPWFEVFRHFLYPEIRKTLKCLQPIIFQQVSTFFENHKTRLIMKISNAPTHNSWHKKVEDDYSLQNILFKFLVFKFLFSIESHQIYFDSISDMEDFLQSHLSEEKINDYVQGISNTAERPSHELERYVSTLIHIYLS